MFEKITEFFANMFEKSDVSGIRKTNSYYRNLEICERMHKREMAQKKEEKRLLKEYNKNKSGR
jgi:hypothetical protein